MASQEFGEILFVARGKYPEGVMIREKKGGVLLEQHFDTTGQNVDVLHMFHEDSTIWDKEDFIEFLKVARQYEPDISVPIYVQR